MHERSARGMTGSVVRAPPAVTFCDKQKMIPCGAQEQRNIEVDEDILQIMNGYIPYY